MAEYYVIGDFYRPKTRSEVIERVKSNDKEEVINFDGPGKQSNTLILDKIEASGIKQAARKLNSKFGDFYTQGFITISALNPRTEKTVSYYVKKSSGKYNYSLDKTNVSIGKQMEQLLDDLFVTGNKTLQEVK